MISILSTRRFARWTRLFKEWLSAKFASISIDLTPVEEKIDSLDEKITPYLYDECSVEEVDHMFTSVTEDGYIIVPSNAINPDGTMPVSVFKAITGLTPTE